MEIDVLTFSFLNLCDKQRYTILYFPHEIV
jgi:hypothetical protein